MIFGDRSWDQKLSKNRSKNGIENAVPLGIVFLPILVDFGGQVGPKNPPKIGQKRHRKNDGKKKSIGTAKKSQCEAATPKNPRVPDPWEGVRGRDKSFSGGEGRDWNSTTALNHPAEAGGIKKVGMPAPSYRFK